MKGFDDSKLNRVQDQSRSEHGSDQMFGNEQPTKMSQDVSNSVARSRLSSPARVFRRWYPLTENLEQVSNSGSSWGDLTIRSCQERIRSHSFLFICFQ